MAVGGLLMAIEMGAAVRLVSRAIKPSDGP
jgi:hypothetical protein